jgi:hypothetical protein
MMPGPDMNEQWQKAIERRNQVREEFKDCDAPGSRAFVAVGITVAVDGPRLIVFTSDIEATRHAIATGPGHDWVDTVRFELSGGFAIPPGPPPWRRLARWLKALLKPLVADICVGAGTEIAGGTVGCVLQDGAGTPYFLTAGHLLPRAGDVARHGKVPIGYVVKASTLPTGLDWSLVKADQSKANSTDEIVFDSPLTLGPELPIGAFQQLPQMVIGMSGAASMDRRQGTVICVGTSLAVTQEHGGVCERHIFDDQVIVQDVSATDPFGIPGDSGAVAYLLSNVTTSGITYRPGAAIALYWGVDETRNDLHIFARLPDVLQAIQSVTNLNLSLLP